MLGPKLTQTIFHFVGRLVRACGCERVSYLANIETGEATFADDAARRDELFMQASAIPADNYEPRVGDNRRGVQRFVRDYAGCDAVNLLAPFDGPHFGTQEAHAHLCQTVIQVDENEIVTPANQIIVEDDGPALVCMGVLVPFGGQCPASP
jgi:hypothetical protein